jgi:integrase
VLTQGVETMSRNLGSQIKYVVNSAFYGDENTGRNGGFGSSKHSDKINHTKNGKIYSYNHKNNVEQVGKEFSTFMKSEHPEVRNVSDLTQKHATEFITYKSNNVGTTTLNYYRSCLNTIAESSNATFKTCNISLETPAVLGVSNEKVKTVAFTQNDLNILKDTYTPNSTGLKAIQIIEATGLRVSEVSNLKNSDITINNNTAVVHVESGKGGRSRDVVVTKPEYVSTLNDIKNTNNEILFTCKSESIDQNIHRHVNQCELSQNYTYNTCHSIRKFYAQSEYDSYRESHSIDESVSHVVSNLGHSATRTELAKVYIQNIH